MTKFTCISATRNQVGRRKFNTEGESIEKVHQRLINMIVNDETDPMPLLYGPVWEKSDVLVFERKWCGRTRLKFKIESI